MIIRFKYLFHKYEVYWQIIFDIYTTKWLIDIQEADFSWL